MINHEWFDGRQSKISAKQATIVENPKPHVWLRKCTTTSGVSALLADVFLGFSFWKGTSGARNPRMNTFKDFSLVDEMEALTFVAPSVRLFRKRKISMKN
jgi:hypothetical protein